MHNAEKHEWDRDEVTLISVLLSGFAPCWSARLKDLHFLQRLNERTERVFDVAAAKPALAPSSWLVCFLILLLAVVPVATLLCNISKQKKVTPDSERSRRLHCRAPFGQNSAGLLPPITNASAFERRGCGVTESPPSTEQYDPKSPSTQWLVSQQIHVLSNPRFARRGN
ncbi:hypothetical protein ACO22_03503 [Paracoccidioides brasiliensis]|uniref:Uncharacterized protein n=1 Tax=Paracoccidioides brasiliensis TaxID=121759 RepID=A0A1D2JFU5_PARBR|nr:hypothetical protein ACO22_03503 [Paracoccidioides brasiliensis]